MSYDFDYVQTAQDALAILMDFGGAEPGITFTHTPGSAPAPGGAPVILPPVTTLAVGLIFTYSDKMSGDGTRADTLIQSGDRQCYIAAIDINGVQIPAPEKEDTALAPDGVIYVVQNVKPLAPNGIPVLYEIQLRR